MQNCYNFLLFKVILHKCSCDTSWIYSCIYGEKCIRIKDFRKIILEWNSHNLFHENQFGFQLNNSTEHPVLQFTRDVTQTLGNGKSPLGISIVHSKAFDTVGHQILNILKIIMTPNIYWKLTVLCLRDRYLKHYKGYKNVRLPRLKI